LGSKIWLYCSSDVAAVVDTPRPTPTTAVIDGQINILAQVLLLPSLPAPSPPHAIRGKLELRQLAGSGLMLVKQLDTPGRPVSRNELIAAVVQDDHDLVLVVAVVNVSYGLFSRDFIRKGMRASRQLLRPGLLRSAPVCLWPRGKWWKTLPG